MIRRSFGIEFSVQVLKISPSELTGVVVAVRKTPTPGSYRGMMERLLQQDPLAQGTRASATEGVVIGANRESTRSTGVVVLTARKFVWVAGHGRTKLATCRRCRAKQRGKVHLWR